MTTDLNVTDIKLKVLSGLHQQAEIDLKPGEYQVGSGDKNDIRLLDTDISPAHFLIKIEDATISLVLHQPVCVNDQLIQAGATHTVEQDSCLLIGTVKLSLLIPVKYKSQVKEEKKEHLNAGSRKSEQVAAIISKASHQGKNFGSRLSRMAYFFFGAVLVSAFGAMATNSTSSKSTVTAKSVELLSQQTLDLNEKELSLKIQGDYLILSGYISTKKQEENVRQIITESKIQNVKSTYHVVQEIQQRITEYLSEPQIKVEYAGNGLFILSGTSASPNYRSSAYRLENDLTGVARIEHRVTIAIAKTVKHTPLELAITSVSMTPAPHFRTADGSRYFVGGRTPEGREVMEINQKKIIFSKDGRLSVYRLVDNQFLASKQNEN
jgi:hypothetical protein